MVREHSLPDSFSTYIRTSVKTRTSMALRSISAWFYNALASEPKDKAGGTCSPSRWTRMLSRSWLRLLSCTTLSPILELTTTLELLRVRRCCYPLVDDRVVVRVHFLYLGRDHVEFLGHHSNLVYDLTWPTPGAAGRGRLRYLLNVDDVNRDDDWVLDDVDSPVMVRHLMLKTYLFMSGTIFPSFLT